MYASKLLTLALFGQLFAAICGNLETASEDESGKKLNVLMVSVSLVGRLNTLLRVGEELSLRGHNVTILTIPNRDEQDKYKTMAEIAGIHYWNVSSEDLPQLNTGKMASTPMFEMMLTTLKPYITTLNKIMAKHIHRSLSAGDWDIVLVNEFMKPFISCMHEASSVPFVAIGANFQHTTHSTPQWPWPGVMHGASSDNMGFTERAMVDIYNFAFITGYKLIFTASLDAISNYCPSVTMQQAVTSVAVNIPLIIPTAVGFEYPRTLSSMTEYVGPLLSKSPTPLTGELEEWLRSKPDKSVVYISMGSMYSLDKESGQAFLEGVMNSNYSLLWSLKKSNQWILEGLDVDPDRVLISDWTPQFSVLGSKAIHSAILHGGFTGLSEALWNGVPVLVFPQMMEQLYNAGRIHFNGLGIHLDADTLSSSKITESLRALDTGEYRSKVANLRKIFRMAGGVKRVADLVEFYEDVGYEHLVPAYAKYQWSWVQYYNADVYALMMLILVIVAMCLITCCKCIRRRCCLEKVKDKND